MSVAFDSIVAELDRRGLLGREVGGQREAVCPAHDDRKPSLRVRDFGDSAGVYCHAPCETEAVLASLDLPLEAVFDSYWTRNGNTREPLATYRYDDERGDPLKLELHQSSGFVRLDESAVSAIRGARFKPYTENGEPRAVWVLIPIVFDLEK